jgi:hypothetical protein
VVEPKPSVVAPHHPEPGKGELLQEASPGAKKSRSWWTVFDGVNLTKTGPGRVEPGETPESGLDLSKRKILDKISRDLREKEAVKSDDAAIPEYLWEDHLVDDDIRDWSHQDRVGLPCAMDLLRGRMLTTSYLSWMKEEHPRLRNKKTRVTEVEVSLRKNARGGRQSWWQNREDGYRWKPGGRGERRTTRVGGGTVSRNPRPIGGRERTHLLGHQIYVVVLG